MTTRDWMRLAICFGATFAAAYAGSIGSVRSSGFYGTLEAPGWAPPSWVFGPVWTTLYAMMATAAWLTWRRAGPAAVVPLTIYGIQLVLNALWTWIFFRWHLGALAVVEIVILWLAIVATIAAFRRHGRVAPWLLAPYLAWVTYAGALTLALWRMNPGVL